MRRFFVGCDAISGDLVTISGRDARHIVKALRLKLGDAIVVVDGVGRRYVGADYGNPRDDCRSQNREHV
jgi:16S rRNA U1498 N3-methylase RsmE